MATKRRGGFRPPELRGTLGTLLRTTTDVVRGALERGARKGRARLDDVRSHRRRHDALGELGEIVLDLIRRGEIDLAELPEARDLVRQLDEFDAEDGEPEPPRAVTRRRFDDRPGPRDAATIPRDDRAAPRDDRAAPRDDRTVARDGRAAARDDRDAATGRARRDPGEQFREGGLVSGARRGAGSGIVSSGARPRRDEPDDGVVSSGARPRREIDDDGSVGGSRFSRPTMPARPRPGDHPSGRTSVIARPGSDEPDPAPSPRRPSLTLPHDPHRKGGISFDDDDLNEYMHPDDVPAKSPPTDPDDGDA